MTAPRGTLEQDHGCYFGLSWRCSFDPPVSPEQLVEGLCAAGWKDNSARNTLLYELRHRDGHTLVIVPRTGRVQLRLNYLVPREQRRVTVDAVFESIIRAIDRFTPSSRSA